MCCTLHLDGHEAFDPIRELIAMTSWEQVEVPTAYGGTGLKLPGPSEVKIYTGTGERSGGTYGAVTVVEFRPMILMNDCRQPGLPQHSVHGTRFSQLLWTLVEVANRLHVPILQYALSIGCRDERMDGQSRICYNPGEPPSQDLLCPGYRTVLGRGVEVIPVG